MEHALYINKKKDGSGKAVDFAFSNVQWDKSQVVKSKPLCSLTYNEINRKW